MYRSYARRVVAPRADHLSPLRATFWSAALLSLVGAGCGEGPAGAPITIRVVDAGTGEPLPARLELRGPGEVFGTRQAGLPPFRVADPVADADLLDLARQEARRAVDAEPV